VAPEGTSSTRYLLSQRVTGMITGPAGLGQCFTHAGTCPDSLESLHSSRNQHLPAHHTYIVA
jgi:hypothetical protein